MSAPNRLLPDGYEALEPFAESWAIATLAGRARRRDDSTPEERQAFYDATEGIAVAALAQLDAKPLDKLDEKERRLLALLLSYGQIALAVEVRKDAEADHAKDRRHMVFTREPGGFPL